MEQVSPNSKIKLDHLGQFYATVNSKENPGTFSITAYLKELLIPEMLQRAVDDLMRRLPFLNVRMHHGFMWYYHEVLETSPQIISENDMSALCSFFENGDNHLMTQLSHIRKC